MFLAAGLLPGQEPVTPPPTVFSVSTTLIQIDSVVTDSKGLQVTNLKSDDFQVWVDGKPQPITNFSYVRLDAPAPAAAKPENVRRSLVLVVDDLSLSWESMYAVRRDLHRFIEEQVQPGELVALWETGRSNSVFQQFTSDKRVLQAAVDNLRWNPAGLGLIDPFERQRSSINRTMSLPAMGSDPQFGTLAGQQVPVTNQANELAYIRLNATGGALDTLGKLMEELRPVGGRKAVVFFSDGVYLPWFDLPGEHVNMAIHDELVARFHKLIDKANRAGAVVYTVDARGLVYLEGESVAALDLSQQGLLQLAEDTGGFATVNSNSFGYALQHIEEEQNGYYLLGFKAPANISTGGAAAKVDYHSIKVKVTGHGLRAHSRSGFFGETDEAARPKYATRQEQMMANVQSLFNQSDLRVRMTAGYRRDAKGQAFVHNLLYVDPREIAFRTDLFGIHYAALDLVVLATGQGADPLAAISRHVAIDVNDEKLRQLKTDGILLTLDVPVKQAGPYQIRACVLDSMSRAAGSAGQYIDIPDLKRQHLAVTTPLIDDVSAATANRFNDAASALREFHAGSLLAFAFRIETYKGGGAGQFDSKIQLYRERTPILSNPATVAPAKSADGRSVSGELRLSSSLPAGHYYLQAMATDRGGKTPRTASSWVEFQVVE